MRTHAYLNLKHPQLSPPLAGRWSRAKRELAWIIRLWGASRSDLLVTMPTVSCGNGDGQRGQAPVMIVLAQNLIDALSLGSLYALIALGVTVIYTVMGMMNFAQGEFIMLPAYALYVLAGLPFAAALGGALLTGIAIAVLADRVAFQPVRDADLSSQLVTSLAAAPILQNAVSAGIDAPPQPGPA